MCRATFKHIPLARPAEQIRLLKLEPGADVIRLNIQTYELTEYLRFVALSYEWGHGSEIHDIIIDGEVFKIRQNLRDALEHIRTLQADTSSRRLFEEDSPYFWIDAIAIDQSNDTEKPHQISIMGKIYRQASHVIAWLGLEQNGDDSAL
ncbi:HET-domain-containing protein, partial [Alternaria alternata]